MLRCAAIAVSALAWATGCTALLVDAPCNDDVNCPTRTVCVAHICQPPSSLVGPPNPCAPQGAVHLTTADDVEALAGCSTLTGDFFVELDTGAIGGLADVRHVDGDLSFANPSLLDSPDPVGGIETVLGSLTITGTGADDLALAFDGLLTVGRDAALASTDMTQLIGFEHLTSVGQDVRLDDNPDLDSVDSNFFNDLTSVGGALEMTDNPSLRPCDLQSVIDVAVGDPPLVDGGGNQDGTC